MQYYIISPYCSSWQNRSTERFRFLANLQVLIYNVKNRSRKAVLASCNCCCFCFSLHRCPDSSSTLVQRSFPWSNRSIIQTTRKWWVLYHLLSSSLSSPTSTDPRRDALLCRHFRWQSIMPHHRQGICFPWWLMEKNKKNYTLYANEFFQRLLVLHFNLSTETHTALSFIISLNASLNVFEIESWHRIIEIVSLQWRCCIKSTTAAEEQMKLPEPQTLKSLVCSNSGRIPGIVQTRVWPSSHNTQSAPECHCCADPDTPTVH